MVNTAGAALLCRGFDKGGLVMIHMLEMHSPNVLGIRVSGRIEKGDVDTVMPLMKEKIASSEKINLYVELESFTGMSMAAVMEKFRHAVLSISHIRKEAVVTDISWMSAVLDVTEKLYPIFPGIEVRHFPTEKREEALSWIAS